MIYGHGDDLYKYDNIRLNFSSNVRPGGMSAGLKQHLENCLNDCNSYPEPRPRELEQLIEEQNKLPQGSVLATNGAVEAFYLIAQWKQHCKSLVYTPSFSEYEDACSAYNHQIEFRLNTKVSETFDYNEELVWLCNPNNPDGKVFNRDFLKTVIQRNVNTLFVIDEAYVDFVEEDISLIKLIAERNNLIITRSLTKRFAIPGLRIGYLVAAPEIITELEKKLIPWRINQLAQKAGLFCLSEENTDEFRLQESLAESKRLQKEIDKIEGFTVMKSDSTFFLVKAPLKASVLKEELVNNYGILIRDASNFRSLNDYHFRVSSQLPHPNKQLIKALKSIALKYEGSTEFKHTIHA